MRACSIRGAVIVGLVVFANALALEGLITHPAYAAPVTITLTPEQDCTIDTTGWMHDCTETSLNAGICDGMGCSPYEARALLRWNLGFIAPGSKVLSAMLHAEPSSPPRPGRSRTCTMPLCATRSSGS
jgi:hypothetical protein